MSRRSFRGDGRRLLLDTSFLLPVIGFETSNTVMRAFEKLRLYTLYYTDLSLLEASWKIVKVVKKGEEEVARIAEGIRAIRKTMNHVSIDEDSFKLAVKMYKLGHRDMVDNLLYSTAVTRRLKLLTVDTELLGFVEEHSLPREHIITPSQLE
ncbi:type II toxin-antitoxin system VapC family toxin [Candidatus Bathyarchaeota archaeon]|nr:MAG: type II toxin-antitoxin system VapC family toxin [Candidatus Bathyarchaeota archaeon]